MRFFLITLATLLSLYFSPAPQSASGAADLLGAPIVDGRGIGGVSIGQTDAQVSAALGRKPDFVEQIPHSPEKMLIYQLAPMTAEESTSLILTMRNGKVACMELSDQAGAGKFHRYKGTSSKGFRFGDSLERINSIYGKPSSTPEPGRYWYRNEGIAFFCIGPESGTIPNSVIILAPGSDLPEYLR